jgi:hypothetical protein
MCTLCGRGIKSASPSPPSTFPSFLFDEEYLRILEEANANLIFEDDTDGEEE